MSILHIFLLPLRDTLNNYRVSDMKRKQDLRHETQNLKKKSQNGDTLGPVELNVRLD